MYSVHLFLKETDRMCLSLNMRRLQCPCSQTAPDKPSQASSVASHDARQPTLHAQTPTQSHTRPQSNKLLQRRMLCVTNSLILHIEVSSHTAYTLLSL